MESRLAGGKGVQMRTMVREQWSQQLLLFIDIYCCHFLDQAQHSACHHQAHEVVL